MKDICCIGHITLDKIVTPDNEFYQNGGTAYYFAYGMNRLPKDVSFQLVTSMAPKDLEAVERMRQEGIDVVAYESHDTVFFENKYGSNKNERTQRVLARSDAFTIDQVKDLEAKVFHLGSWLSDDFSPEVGECLANKGRGSMDVQGYLREVRGEQVFPIDWADKRRVLEMTDTLKLNEYEMEVVTGEKDPRRVARVIAGWGVREVVVTFGSYGSLIFADGKYYDIPAFTPKKNVDVTGCGDTFSTGYLYCRAKDIPCDEAGRFAAAMCTLKIEHPGPFSGTVEDVLQLMESAHL